MLFHALRDKAEKGTMEKLEETKQERTKRRNLFFTFWWEEKTFAFLPGRADVYAEEAFVEHRRLSCPDISYPV